MTVRKKPVPRTGRSAADLKSQYDPAEEISHLRDVIKAKDRDHEQYKKETGRLRVLFDELREAVEALPPPKIDYTPPRVTTVAQPVTHVCHWTDWHYGAVQIPEEIEGFNEFNPDILEKYLKNCVRNQLEWVELHRKSYRVDVCHNLCTGDYISGGIHQELLITNAFPEPVQAIRAGDLLAEIIAMQAPHYTKVVVDAITTDNHGRLTKKPQAAEAGINTWNYVVLHHAKARLRDFANVEFNIHEGIFTTVPCGGRRYLLTHGDRVKGWAGFPYYSLDRMAARESIKRVRRVLKEVRDAGDEAAATPKSFDALRAAFGHLYDRIILGHWHAPLANPYYWIGGSACGTTAYDHSEGRYSEPIQCAWFVDPKWGEFDRTDWYLRTGEA